MKARILQFLLAVFGASVLPLPAFAQETKTPEPPVFHARVVQDFVLDGDLSEWTGEGSRHRPISLDAKENLVLPEKSSLSRDWGGPADLSGTFRVGCTATDLVIAGEVHDDELTLNPKDWWMGDEIEVFFDLDLDPDEADPAEYNGDDYQLILFPLAPGPTWGFAVAGSRRGRSDGGFDGVRTEAKRLSGPEGKYAGYTFELAIPLVNFPGLRIREGTTIGFALALVDADGSYGQKTYMTVDGRGGLASDPSRFGRLVFDEDLPPVPVDAAPPAFLWIEPALILLGALVAVFLLWRFRRFLNPLTELPVRTKLVIFGSLVLLVALAGVLPGLVLDARRSSRRTELASRVDLLRSTLAEAKKEQLLGAGATGPDPERLMSLLTGGEVTPPELYEYLPSFASEPAPSRTRDQVPVLDYARPLGSGSTATSGSAPASALFELPDPVEASGAIVVLRFLPDRASRLPLNDESRIGTVSVFLERDGRVVEQPLLFNRQIDSAEGIGEDGHAATAAAVAWHDRDAGTHADEVRIVLDTPARVTGVEVKQVASEGTLVVHGVTLVVSGADGYRPLPLRAETLVGVPTNRSRDRPPGADVVLGRENDSLRLPLHPPVDRIWLFHAKPPAPPAEQDPAGLDMLTVTVVGDDGPIGTPTTLKNGEELDSEILYSLDHPPEFRAPIAWRWTPPPEWTRHRDATVIDVADRDAARALVLRWVGRSEPVLVAGITEGRRLPHSVGPDLTRLVAEDGRYRLAAATEEKLADLELTWYRGGRAEATTYSATEGREAVLGSALPAGALAGEGDEPTPESRTLGAREYLSSFYRVDRADVIELSLPVRESESLKSTLDVAYFVLLGLLLLVLLLLVADLLSRMSRIRTKLTVGFAVAALVPLLLFFLGLQGILEREAGRTERGSLLEQVRQVRGKFEEIREDVRRKAQDVLDDDDLRVALAAVEETPTEYADRTEARVRALAATASPFGGRALVAVQDTFPAGAKPGPRVFASSGTAGDIFNGVADPVDDLTYRWSKIRFEGVASEPPPRIGGRRTVAVRVPVGPELLENMKNRFGQQFELLLFTMRGYPYAGTLSLTGERDPHRAAARREIAEEIDLNRNPVIRQETLAGAPCSVAYDLVRTRTKEPVALLAVALPRQRFVAARSEVRNLFLLLGAVILVLEVVVGNILTRRITDPLTALSRGARAVAAGKLETRVSEEDGGEIGALSASFNRMTAELSRRIEELGRLNAAIRDLSGSLEREPVLERSIEAFRQAIDSPSAVYVLLSHDDEVEIAAGRRGDRPVPAVRLPRRSGLFSRALAAKAARALAAPTAEDSREAAQVERQAAAGMRSGVTIPFAAGRESPGAVLVLFDRDDPGLAPSDLEFLSTMAQQVGIALENARLYQLAIEDVVTGLYVHSYFVSRLREETDRAVAGSRPLSVLLIGLDEVEWVYDTYGPEEGDHVLNRVVRRLRSAVRGLFVLARADRNTVEVILPDADKDRALALAREIREEARRIVVRLKGEPSREIRITPSIGLATCPDDARSAEFLLAAAHEALYKAVTDRAGTKLVDVGRERQRVQTELSGKAGRFVFRSEKMLELLETVDRIAASDVPILVLGETGVGKEVLAEIVHEKSRRRGKPLVKVNCAALPEALLESELFGHERGAFTGADRRKPGRFELADGGTLFLDEIGEIPPQTQVKLLRVLQDHRVERLGGTGPIRVDVRIIAATNADLTAAIREGRFREDLYFRLNVVSLVLPPLRARKEEIPALVDSFLAAHAKTHRTAPRHLAPAAMDKLFSHSWPGNVRELRNTIERALAISRDEEIQPHEIVFPEPTKEVSRRAIEEVLSRLPAHAPDDATARPSETSRAAPPRSDGELNIRQRKLLEYLTHRDTISNREYSDLVGVSARTGNRDIGELLELGLIEKIGRKRSAVYRRRR